MKLHFGNDWLRHQIETDLDVETDSGRVIRSSADVMNLVGLAQTVPDVDSDERENTLGLLVHQTRRSEKLTVDQFAERIGVAMHEIQTIEEYLGYTPQPRTIFKLAEYVKVPPRSLLALVQGTGNGDGGLYEAKHQFAASSDDLSQLSKPERRGLNDFVKFLAAYKSEPGSDAG